uniref:EF-hand domain-containing protein n=1 Tax=Haptolina brevifila TaxID=156173 RepID=A0A7S2BAI3_9EUKA
MGNACCPGDKQELLEPEVQTGDVIYEPKPAGYGGAGGGDKPYTQVEVKAPANRTVPPGRVRHMFKMLDKDGSGGLTMEEMTKGFAKEFKVEKLADHVLTAMAEMFKEHGTISGEGKVITTSKFSRFYAEVLFKHFDKDNSGTLELAEVQEALKFLVKPNEAGERIPPIVAFPPQHYDDKGQVHLPMKWFWTTFTAMD